jgi:hypothetical protein
MVANLNPVNMVQVFLANDSNCHALIADANRICVRTPASRWHVRTNRAGVAIPWSAAIQSWLFGYLGTVAFLEMRNLFIHSDELIILGMCIIAQRLEDMANGASSGPVTSSFSGLSRILLTKSFLTPDCPTSQNLQNDIKELKSKPSLFHQCFITVPSLFLAVSLVSLPDQLPHFQGIAYG